MSQNLRPWGGLTILLCLFLLAAGLAIIAHLAGFPEGATKFLWLSTIPFLGVVFVVWEILLPKGPAGRLWELFLEFCKRLGTK
jgi:hypothetical protein